MAIGHQQVIGTGLQVTHGGDEGVGTGLLTVAEGAHQASRCIEHRDVQGFGLLHRDVDGDAVGRRVGVGLSKVHGPVEGQGNHFGKVGGAVQVHLLDPVVVEAALGMCVGESVGEGGIGVAGSGQLSDGYVGVSVGGAFHDVVGATGLGGSHPFELRGPVHRAPLEGEPLHGKYDAADVGATSELPAKVEGEAAAGEVGDVHGIDLSHQDGHRAHPFVTGGVLGGVGSAISQAGISGIPTERAAVWRGIGRALFGDRRAPDGEVVIIGGIAGCDGHSDGTRSGRDEVVPVPLPFIRCQATAGLEVEVGDGARVGRTAGERRSGTEPVAT